MGLFDNALRDSVPGGNLAKPLILAAGALLLARMFSHGSSASAPAPAPAPAPANVPPQPTGAPAQPDDGGLLGGLGGLLDKFRNAGHEETVNSWVGTGPNAPLQPGQLGNALGQQTISDLARHAGISEDELLNQLSQVLPGLVDKLTPNGRLPTLAEITASAHS